MTPATIMEPAGALAVAGLKRYVERGGTDAGRMRPGRPAIWWRSSAAPT